MNKINEASFFFIQVGKKTDEGHWIEMRESLRNHLLFLFGLTCLVFFGFF